MIYRAAACTPAVLSALCCLASLWFAKQHRDERLEFMVLVTNSRLLHGQPAPGTLADALALMDSVHHRLDLARRLEGQDQGGHSLNFTSSHEQLRAPQGACASYSQVLAKTLRTAGYDVRKVGMTRGALSAQHHVIEACIAGRWVLMDPLYNLVFHAPDGHPLSVSEWRVQPASYASQAPAADDSPYDYTGCYYTNWSRVPLVGGFIRSSGLEGWLEAHAVSLRAWFYDIYLWAASGALLLAVLILGAASWRRARAKRRFAAVKVFRMDEQAVEALQPAVARAH